jgi:hypothetical protein
MTLDPLVEWFGIIFFEVDRLATRDRIVITLIKLCALSVREKFPDAASQELLRAHTDNLCTLFTDVGITPVLVQHGQAVGDASEHALQSMAGLWRIHRDFLKLDHV